MSLYYLIIYPIRQLLEICFILFNEMSNNAGLSVIGLSFVVTICCLPLYIIAENWQDTERKKQDAMRDNIKRIKTAFKGDEQFMMLTTYYKEQHYHPMMALRSSFGLLIQIPFFIAAYGFLSHLPELSGSSFLFVRDMGKPDALFTIGTFTVNILPIAMTLINGVSGAIYSKGHGAREKIQIYVSAALFLVLLYDSPAGLVIYWTMNNILSLVKNVFYKLKHPIQVLYGIACAAGIYGLWIAAYEMRSNKIELRAILALICLAIITCPLWLKAINWFITTFLADCNEHPKERATVFVLSALTLAVLTGLTIPSMLMESEPVDFCYVDNYTTPFFFLRTAFFQGLGMYVFWPICFYALFPKKIKNILTVCMVFCASYAMVNNFAFSGTYGPIDRNLDFMQAQFFTDTLPRTIINAALALLLIVVTTGFLTKKVSSLIPCFMILTCGMTIVSLRNISFIRTSYVNMEAPKIRNSVDPVFHLSKTKPNVLVFMQDRLVSPLLDDIFEEAPELSTHFDGFVYYPNTVSFGELTMLGTPGLFGGYEYTPWEMNRRTNQTLREKHNEAILSMPLTFLRQGWTAAVSDIPYENYGKEPITDMYKDYPEIQREWLNGAYTDYWYHENNIEKIPYISMCIKHNLIMFGIFKSFPPILRRLVHHSDWWNVAGSKDNFSKYIDSHSVLCYLSKLFATDADKSAFVLLDNETTHEPTYLQAPDYVPVKEVTNYGNSKWKDLAQYHAQASTLRLYAHFFDYLKEQGVYDNTRIIIVSDHGFSIPTGKLDNSTGVPPFRKEHVTASLLVKDFNAHTLQSDGVHLQKDMTFMTNADTPYLATKDIVPHAKNPFTGNPFEIKQENKAKWIKICYPHAESTRIRDRSYFYVKENTWVHVQDNIFDNTNWSMVQGNP